MPGSTENQIPLLISTPIGEKPNPEVVTIVVDESIRHQIEQDKPNTAASVLETQKINDAAEERRKQHSA